MRPAVNPIPGLVTPMPGMMPVMPSPYVQHVHPIMPTPPIISNGMKVDSMLDSHPRPQTNEPNAKKQKMDDEEGGGRDLGLVPEREWLKQHNVCDQYLYPLKFLSPLHIFFSFYSRLHYRVLSTLLLLYRIFLKANFHYMGKH